MKKNTIIAVLAFASLGFVSHASAQNVSWSPFALNMVGDTDVLNNGAYVDAATFNSTALTVNSVTFNPITSGSDGLKIAITTPNGVGPYTAAFSTATPSSANYSALTANLGFGFFANGTVTLSGLTPGDNYQVEAWSYYTGEAAGLNTVFTGTNSVGLNSLVGQYAVGTFTAPASLTTSTETFNYDFTNGDGHTIINAVSLRDITVAPEPSTWTLMVGGFGLLIFCVRRRSAFSK